jgi:uncharacterized repeat protein (TIGR01451 family)
MTCTAGEFTIQPVFSAAPGTDPFCVLGQTFSFLVELGLSGTNADRQDIGFFVGQTGNDPRIDDAAKLCSVATFPASPLPWKDNDADTCGDYAANGNFTTVVDSIKVVCSGDSSGALQVPYVVTYWQNNGNVCTGPATVTNGAPSKCNAGTAPVSGIVSVYAGAYVDVTKQTLPDGDSQSFSFTATGPAGSRVVALINGTYTPANSATATNTVTVSLSDNQTARFFINALTTDQTLTVTEAATTGWQSTASISCSPVTGSPALTTNNASRSMSATLNTTSSAAACTITNTRQPKVTITKVSIGSTGTFNFIGTNGIANHDITTVTPGSGAAGATQTLTNADTATDISESVPPAGFGLSDISCSGLGTGGTATNDLANRKVALNAAATAPGTNIACTFTNDRQRTFTVTKSLSPITDSGQFVMNANGTNGAAAGNGATAVTLVGVGATATFSEAGSDGTNLSNYSTSFSCNTTPAAAGNAASGSLTMPDADVTCTVTNTRKSATLTIRKTWFNGINGDTATVSSSGFTNNASSGASVSSGDNTTTGPSVTVYAGESGTISESFIVGSAANYTATLSCSGNTTPLSGNALTIDPADTAIVCTETNTLVSGVAISGFVYNDLNHSNGKDGAESGTGQTLYAKITLRSGSTCNGPATVAASVDGSTGIYSIPNITAGDYCLIIDTNNTLADISPSYPSGWTGTEMPGGIRYVSVGNNALILQDFGLFSGSTLTGTVFRDNGSGGGTANDGILNGTEAGISNVSVRLSDTTESVIYDSKMTDGNGMFVLYIPGSLLTGTALKIMETTPGGYVSTGAATGNTGGTYSRTTDIISFVLTSGITYSSLGFGDVPVNQFLTDGSQTALPDTTLYYPHIFVAGSAGTASFSTTSVSTPDIPGWSEILYSDPNCNGTFDAGEPQITSSVTAASGQQICILLKEFVPANAPVNAQNQSTVTAAFSYMNALPVLNAVASRTDITTVGQASSAGLNIVKSVDNASVLPGQNLTYTITYTNQSAGLLSSIVISDSAPAYTTYVSGTCGAPLPANITLCTVSQQPAPGGTGTVQWTLTGTLVSGATGSVSYTVQVQN